MTSPSGPAASGAGHSSECTDWGSMSISEVLAKIGEMQTSSASGDAEAVMSAVKSALAVAAKLRHVFGTGDSLYGMAADGSLAAGRTLAADIETSTHDGGIAADALASAATVLGSAHTHEPDLHALGTHLSKYPEDAAEVRAHVKSIMSNAYSTPMMELARTVPYPRELAGHSNIAVGSVAGGSVAAGGSGSGAATYSRLGGTVDSSGSGSSAVESVSGRESASTESGDDSSTPAQESARATPRGDAHQADDQPSAGHPGGLPHDRQGDSLMAVGDGHLGAAARRRRGYGPSEKLPTSPGADAGAGDGAGGPDLSAVADLGVLPPAGPVGPFVPGSATATSATAPSAGVAATPSAPRSTLSPVGPPGGPGAPTAGSRDEKHRSASYLSTRENGEDIVGGLPLVGPPVIGDWVSQPIPAHDRVIDVADVGEQADLNDTGATGRT
ncbi:MAG: hypothetical protein QM673_15175 [Gordonia sp. (in: high G+C Gram-positive bacteria)]